MPRGGIIRFGRVATSRDTFYRYQAAVEAGGIDALLDANRRKPNIKNLVEEATEAAVTAFTLEQPAFGQVSVSNELRKRAIFVSFVTNCQLKTKQKY